MNNQGYVEAIRELAKRIEINNDFDAYVAASYALLPIALDAMK
jgi:hypothetical protein